MEGRLGLEGGGTGGASVIVGEHDGLNAQMQQAYHGFLGLGFMHRYALSSSLDINIIDMLLRLF